MKGQVKIIIKLIFILFDFFEKLTKVGRRYRQEDKSNNVIKWKDIKCNKFKFWKVCAINSSMNVIELLNFTWICGLNAKTARGTRQCLCGTFPYMDFPSQTWLVDTKPCRQQMRHRHQLLFQFWPKQHKLNFWTYPHSCLTKKVKHWTFPHPNARDITILKIWQIADLLCNKTVSDSKVNLRQWLGTETLELEFLWWCCYASRLIFMCCPWQRLCG